MIGHDLDVRRLRLSGRISNPHATRGRIERALTAGASGSLLSAEAILCVRRIRGSLSRLERFPAVLEAEISSAARPAYEAVPANANAILFADRAELLACLARDWCAGSGAAQWWWPVLFPRADIAEVVRRAWLENARPVPAALDRLVAVNLGELFLRKLAPDDGAALWRNTVATFQLEHLEEAWSRAIPESAATHLFSNLAPWAPWFSFDPALPPDLARLLVAAVLLQRAPAVIRSSSFQRRVRGWIEAGEVRDPVSNDDRSRTEAGPKREQAHPPVVPERANWRPRLPDDKDSSKRRIPSSERLQNRSVPPNRAQALLAKRFPGAPQNIASPEPLDSQIPLPPAVAELCENGRKAGKNRGAAAGEGEKMVARETSSFEKVSNAREITPLPEPAGEETIFLPAPSVERIATEWGGILYLINVAIEQELYGDFTAPLQVGLALPLWDFLALTGEQFVGEALRLDPLPQLLARLSGRACDEPPGAHFETPPGESLAEWLETICHRMRDRLRQALNPGESTNAVSLVLRQRAKIVASPSRVDAYFSLADHPIALRIAGLDRDPGWIPAAGRAVHFHYD